MAASRLCLASAVLLSLACSGSTSNKASANNTDAASHSEDTSHSSAEDTNSQAPDTTLDSASSEADTKRSGPPAWDNAWIDTACTVASNAPLLDDTLKDASLTQKSFTFTEADYKQSGYFTGGYLDDPFLLSWFRETQAAPAESACFVKNKAAALDVIAAGAHPTAGAIRHAAKLIERFKEGAPLDPSQQTGALKDAIQAACNVIGKDFVPSKIDLPEALQNDLTPVFFAMANALKAHQDMLKSAEAGSPEEWFMKGNPGVLVLGETMPVTDAKVMDYLLGKGVRDELNLAAAQLAFAIESVDWSQWRNKTGINMKLSTPLGWIWIADGSDQEYENTSDAVWFFLDLGGNDKHLDRIGANTHWQIGVNVAIDLDGNDVYSYPPGKTTFDKPWLLPSDEDGRLGFDTNYGHITLSRRTRQGGAANGIAMLYDLGTGNDIYESLAMSQGYAHIGVGVLYDEGGDDIYRSEIASQGSAGYGIGLLLDVSGNDKYETFSRGQGFGYVGGAGFLFDGGGNDTYFSNPGKEGGGQSIYFSPQMPQQGNSAFTQGAGFGMRWDHKTTFWSGGIGILRDASGDDKYTTSVFGQGTGYWQGTGILSDGDGADTYDAFWYVQGGAAHYAIGILMDGGAGDDNFNQNIPTRSMQLGAGHDYSLGVYVNESGNEKYNFGALAIGASNCNGIGLFVENGGNDEYATKSTSNTGFGNIGGECKDTRPNAISIGIMLETNGNDTYDYPESEQFTPANNSKFGHTGDGMKAEHGGAQDVDNGESGIHAP